MLKGSDIIGIPLVVSSERTGVPDEDDHETISNWILDYQINYLSGLLVAQGGWAGGARILLWEHVDHVTPASVNTNRCSPVIETGRVVKVITQLEASRQLLGVKLLSRHGEELGHIADFYFDEGSGEVIGLEVSRQHILKPEPENIFVPISKPLNIVDSVALATPTMVSAIQTFDSQHKETFDLDRYSDNNIEMLIGNRIKHDVRDYSGIIVAAAGQIVTQAIIDATIDAQAEDMLHEAVLQAT